MRVLTFCDFAKRVMRQRWVAGHGYYIIHLASVCKTVLGVGPESDGEVLTDFRVQALGVRRSSLCVSATARVDPTWLDTHLRDWATLTV